MTTRHEREESVTQQELSLLPVGYALVEPLGQAPALVHMIMFTMRLVARGVGGPASLRGPGMA